MDKNKLSVNTYDKIAQIFADKYFDYDKDLAYIDLFISKLSPKARILDVGCGVGGTIKYFRERGFLIEGIDLSPKTIKVARKKVPQAKFKVMDMRHLDYPENSFDALLSIYSLIHIEPRQISPVLLEFRKVLKEKGLALIIVQGGKEDMVLAEPLNKKLKNYFNFFSKARLNQYLREAGFKVVFQEETSNPDKDCCGEAVIYTFAQKNIS